ncbi:phosphate ABC transporter permease subunit PstC [Roseibium polysiphoniae]|uniref:Phosphate transport system permease protein n=1 Tax=Roseibium polysiphoniae TaxID=2571221 RepID=A0ABR9CAP5_9HYPH|nr:phosphate ABC transporter permease subunit PstC [Roseibium polysiphoniae]MBD8876673.1 phosphate ABC transporter permease subunit PstC [Roseibium polysiphoniae]
MTTLTFAILLIVSCSGYLLNRRAARSLLDGGQRLHSIPQFHGLYSGLTILVPVLTLVLLWLVLQGPLTDWIVMAALPTIDVGELSSGARQLLLAEIKSIAGGRMFGTPADWKIAAADRLVFYRNAASLLLLLATLLSTLILLMRARGKVTSEFRARQGSEKIIHGLLVFCSTVAIFTTIGIIFALLFETIKFFRLVPVTDFLFGLNWEPQIPIREDQIAAAGAFGWLPVLLGTLVITVLALFIAVPVGLVSAVYLNEFAPRNLRKIAKPLLEILAGVPTVVYGFFAVLVVAPAIRGAGQAIGLPVSPNTAMAAGGVMGIMLIPFISSFADDAMSAVPRALRDGALALGATRAEMMMNIVFPAAIPGIAGGVLLAVSRAIGETMIVVMAAGLIASLTINPLDSVTTITVQIVTLLIGDTSFDNPKTLAAFALGMMLFLVTLGINIFAIRIVRKYREAYD